MFGKLHHAACRVRMPRPPRESETLRIASHDHVATECEFEATAITQPARRRHWEGGARASIDSPAACRFSRRIFL